MTPKCNSDETFSSHIHHKLKPSAKQFTNHPEGESLPICFQGLEKVKKIYLMTLQEQQTNCSAEAKLEQPNVPWCCLATWQSNMLHRHCQCHYLFRVLCLPPVALATFHISKLVMSINQLFLWICLDVIKWLWHTLTIHLLILYRFFFKAFQNQNNSLDAMLQWLSSTAS